MSKLPLYIWLLRRTDTIRLSETDSAVIAASTELEARELAYRSCAAINPSVWVSPSTEVHLLGEGLEGDVTALILESFNAR